MSNHFISLNDAKTMTAKFRTNRESMLITSMQGKDVLFHCETFDLAAFTVLMNESGATQLRFYLGMDEADQVRIIAVAADESGNDILPGENDPVSAAAAAVILELGIRCPPNCPPALL